MGLSIYALFLSYPILSSPIPILSYPTLSYPSMDPASHAYRYVFLHGSLWRLRRPRRGVNLETSYQRRGGESTKAATHGTARGGAGHGRSITSIGSISSRGSQNPHQNTNNHVLKHSASMISLRKCMHARGQSPRV